MRPPRLAICSRDKVSIVGRSHFRSIVKFRPFLEKTVTWLFKPPTNGTRWSVLTELVLLRTSIIYAKSSCCKHRVTPSSPVTGNSIPLHFRLPHQLTLSKMPLPAGKIYSFEEARKAASPYGFVIGPSINVLGERDPNIGVVSVADGKNTEIKFSLV